MQLDIKNKTRFELPDYVAGDLREICLKAGIPLEHITLIVKRRNRCIGDCWTKKGNRDIPSGQYKVDYRTVVVRIGRKTNRDDFRFVLAHEIGHLKQHRESKLKVKMTEAYANDFATLTCNCYPKSFYSGIKKR